MTRHDGYDLAAPERLSALQRAGLLDDFPDESYDRFSRLAGRLLRAPLALINAIAPDRQFSRSSIVPPDWMGERTADLADSFCVHAVRSGERLVIEDASTDARVASSRMFTELGLRSYAGVPLIIEDGAALGALCVADLRPRRWTDEELQTLDDLAAAVTTEIQLRLQISERRRVTAELERSQATLRAITDASPDVIEMLDGNGIFAWMSPSTEEVLGYKPEELIGRAMLELVHPEDHHYVGPALESPTPADISMRYRARSKYGSWLVLEARGRPLPGTDAGKVLVVRDVTTQDRLQNALAERERQLSQAQRIAELGSFEWDSETNEITWSDEMYRLFGVRPETFSPTIASVAALVNRDDRARVMERGSAAIAAGRPVDVEYSITRPDGEVRMHQGRAEAITTRGRVQRLTGTIHDVTDRTRREAQLRRAEVAARSEYLRSMLQSATDIVSVIDANGTITYESPSVQTVLGYAPEDLVGRNGLSFVHPDDLELVQQALATVLGDPARSLALQFRFMHADGSWRWLQATGRNLTSFPDIAGIVINSRDVTADKQAAERITRQMDQLAALHAIDTAIAGSVDLRVIARVALDELVTNVGAEGAAILIWDEATLRLLPVASRGLPARGYGGTALGEGLAGRVAVERKLISTGLDAALPASLGTQQFAHYIGVPLISQGRVRAVMELYFKGAPSQDPEFLRFIEAVGAQAVIAIDSARLFEDLQRTNAELSIAYDATLEGWSSAVDLRDRETEGHTRRVTDLTVALARKAGISDADIVHVRRGALLHDIGKLGVPDAILLKPGALDESEWEMMRRHPVYAHDWLARIPYLRQSLAIPYCHHEKWDGTGYPRGLKGEEIPIEARLFALVDVWDALRSDRPYRKGWDVPRVARHIQDLSGTHFDPQYVPLFLELTSGL